MALAVKNPPADAEDKRDTGLIPGSGRSPGGGQWQLTPVFLPGESHGQSSLTGSTARSTTKSQTLNSQAEVT